MAVKLIDIITLVTMLFHGLAILFMYYGSPFWL